MKELSLLIEVFPISGLTPDFSISDLSSGRYEKFDFLANDLNFVPTAEDSAGGTIYNCDNDLTVDILNDKAINRLITPTSCIIRLKADGRDIILGSYYIPATVLLVPHLQRSKLNVKCKMLKSPF